MQLSTPKELYTAKTLFTLGGASFSVLMLTGALSNSFGWSPKWLGLVFSELLAFVGVSLLPREVKRLALPLLVVAFCNGLLIYTQAIGFNTLNQGASVTRNKQFTLLPVLDTKPWWPPADQKVAAEGMVQSARDVATSISEFKNVHKTDPSLPSDLAAQLSNWQARLTEASDRLSQSYGETPPPALNVDHPPVSDVSSVPTTTPEQVVTDLNIPAVLKPPQRAIAGEDVYDYGQPGVLGPKVTSKPSARYPQEAIEKSKTGVVRLSVVFRKDGRIGDVRVVKSVGHGLDEEAIKAALQIKFTPGLKDGKPANIRKDVQYTFSINNYHEP